MVGQTIAQYKVLAKLGEGGMGVVWHGRGLQGRGHQAALKFLNAASLTDGETKTRFLHEAQAAAALDHPNICGVYEISEERGRLFIAMPFLEGGSLDTRITQAPRPISEVLDIAIQTAEALEEAHGKGVVHRDIKPANVMVNERGRGRLHCTLMDFGRPASPRRANSLGKARGSAPRATCLRSRWKAPQPNPRQTSGRCAS